MIFTYEIADKIVPALETQVENVEAFLQGVCRRRIKGLLQAAREEALQKTAGEVDVPALVQAAGMKKKQRVGVADL